MRKHKIFLLALGCCALTAQSMVAQNPRQAARQERRETRQDMRMNNRGAYYSDQTWQQINPWVTRNNVQPVPATRVGAALNAAGNAAERASNAAANATDRVGDAAANVANRAANATERAANAATNRANNLADRVAANANARFGYSTTNANTPQSWFYDYYTYSPTYYSTSASGSKYYERASRYHDYDNDGVYDSISTYRDADQNGDYDAYDQIDFGATKTETESRADDYVSDAQRHTVTGTVNGTKLVKVNGTQNLVVRINSNQGNSDGVIVDLGPADHWKSQSEIREGDKLTATGAMEQVGEKQVLIAETVAIGQQKEIVIARFGSAVEGQVVDVTRTEVKGTEHVMAVIEAEQGRRIVDLGPANRLKVKVEPQTKISVQGVPVQFRDYSVVLADRINLDGQAITIERW